MAEVTRVTSPSLASLLPDPSQKITGLVAGEDLDAGDCCYISTTDGMVYKSNGTAATQPAKVHGWVLILSKAGEPCTLVHDMNIKYGSALVPGTNYFVSAANPGKLSDVATTGGIRRVAFAVDTTRIHAMLSDY